MEEWKTRHPHAAINTMTQKLIRSIQENDLIQAHSLGNQILALNTMAEERQKNMEIDLENFKKELENSTTKTEKEDHDERLAASESFSKLQNDFYVAKTNLKEKDTKIESLESQIRDMACVLEDCEAKLQTAMTDLPVDISKTVNQIVAQAFKENDVKIEYFENENKSLNLEVQKLRDQSLSYKSKCQKLELEAKENRDKMAIFEVNAKRSQSALESEKEMSYNLTLKVISLGIELKTLKSKSEEQQNLQIEDCVACGCTREEILAFLPCFHAKTCKRCSKKILASVGSKCPYCREKVNEFKKVFV